LSDQFRHRNHYLPEKYQHGFTSGDGKVWVFDRKTCRYWKGAPRNIGIERDFYTVVDHEGNSSDIVEHVLTAAEGGVWPVIERIDQGAETIDDEERGFLALFAALMKTRTPAFDQMSNNFAKVFFKQWAKERSSNVEQVVAEYRSKTGSDLTVDEARRVYADYLDEKYTIEMPRQNNIKMMLGMAEKLAQEISQLDWAIYWTKSDYVFVTSDNPFIVGSDTQSEPTLPGVGILSPGAISFVPLSKNSMLSFRVTGKKALSRVHATREFVRRANHCIANASDRFTLARDELQLRKLVKRTRIDQWQNNFCPVLISP
jgi:hypothetical protein